MITLEQFLMGRDKEYPLTIEMALKAADLLARVNWLLGKLGIEAKVSSGYRPGRFNKAAGGAKGSEHLTCGALDLMGQEIALILQKKPELLEEAGLWMEHPNYTPTWCHLDTKKRRSRIFIPA